MSQRVDGLLRDAVRDLAGRARPVALADAAIAQGRRLRRRRASLIAAGAAMVVAASLVVPSVLLRGDPAPIGAAPTNQPTTNAPATPAPAVLGTLPAGLIVGAITLAGSGAGSDPVSGEPVPDQTPSLVWNRVEQRYVEVPYPEAIPSPSGTVASVMDPYEDRYGLLDIASGQVRWLDLLANGRATASSLPAWSPDGRHLAIPEFPKDGDFAVVIVDATDGSMRRLTLSWEAFYCAELCLFGWRDADTLTLPIGRNVSEALAPTYSGVRQISVVDGRHVGNVDLPGAYVSGDDWSVDGRYVMLTTANGTTDRIVRHIVYDTVEQREIGPGTDPLDTVWVSPTEWLDTSSDREIRLRGLDGATRATYTAPELEPAHVRSPHIVLVPA